MIYQDYIREIPDHPKTGILFRDIQPLLGNHKIFEKAVMDMLNLIDYNKVDYFIGIESRGFIFSTSLSLNSGRGNKLIRKQGKLPPHNLVSLTYHTEYSSDKIEMEKGHGKVIIVDDVYATGGTMNASVELAEKAGYKVIDTICFLDIGLIKNHNTKCLISY